MMVNLMAVTKIPQDTNNHHNSNLLETISQEITNLEIPQIEAIITDTSNEEVVINMIDLIEEMINALLRLLMDLLVINPHNSIIIQVLSNRSYSSERP